LSNLEDIRQVVRSSGSIGANYIEANESLSKKDFLMKVKICRKEAKESRYWLRLIDPGDDAALKKHLGELVQEVTELMNIFGAILRKSE
jgi:four helix bundle protein